MEVEVDPNLRNAKDGSPATTEGARRPRGDEGGPEASLRDGGYGGKPPRWVSYGGGAQASAPDAYAKRL